MTTVRVTYKGGFEDFRTYEIALSYVESVDLGEYTIDVISDDQLDKELAERKRLLHEYQNS